MRVCCKRALQERHIFCKKDLYSAKETYILKEPTNHSYPIWYQMRECFKRRITLAVMERSLLQKIGLVCRALLQKRPMFSGSLLIVVIKRVLQPISEEIRRLSLCLANSLSHTHTHSLCLAFSKSGQRIPVCCRWYLAVMKRVLQPVPPKIRCVSLYLAVSFSVSLSLFLSRFLQTVTKNTSMLHTQNRTGRDGEGATARFQENLLALSLSRSLSLSLSLSLYLSRFLSLCFALCRPWQRIPVCCKRRITLAVMERVLQPVPKKIRCRFLYLALSFSFSRSLSLSCSHCLCLAFCRPWQITSVCRTRRIDWPWWRGCYSPFPRDIDSMWVWGGYN